MEMSTTREATSCTAIQNSPAFHGARRFITFKRALHWSLSCTRPIQSILHHPISPRSILILSTHLCLDLHYQFLTWMPTWGAKKRGRTCSFSQREKRNCEYVKTKMIWFQITDNKIKIRRAACIFCLKIHISFYRNAFGFSPRLNYTDRGTANCRWS
jgi:hypothetical protein